MLRKILLIIIICISSSNIFADEISSEKFQKLLSLHELKRAPGPYDWMATQNESGQTYEDFINSSPIRPDDTRKYLYLTLLGQFDEKRKEIIDKTAKYLEDYFGIQVKFTDPVSLAVIPLDFERQHPQTGDRQILTSYVLEEILIPNLPKDAVNSTAFSSVDLWPGVGWNFVYGQASIDDRVGVWSIYRNGDPNKSAKDYQICLLRTVKSGVHEIGHMFGLHHCPFYECLMNGSNHREETDRTPMWLCPICLRKLSWSLNLDPVERYKRLKDTSEELGFEKESQFFRKSLNILK